MAVAQVADRILVTVNSTLFNQRIMSTFCYGISSITGAPEQSALFTALHTKFVTADNLIPLYRACCAAELEVNAVWYQVIYPTRYVKVVKNSGLGVGTYGDGFYNTANSAITILRRGDFGNRRNVSTLHMPLPNDVGAASNGQVGPDIDAPLNALAAYMALDVTTATTVATLSPIINNGPGPGDYTPITTVSVGNTVRTMRRRNVGQGI